MKNLATSFQRLLKNKVIFTFLFFLFAGLIIFVEHRFILFKNIYKCFGNCVGSEDDTYYNLSIFLQRSEEIFKGNLYSLNSDHFTWFYDIIGLTSHNTASSFVFGILYKISNNPILSFNFLYFGNLFLTQIGVLLLCLYYSKNKYLSLFFALLIPISSATNWNFYTGHIHASLFWALPFWLLFSEKFFEFSKWNLKKILYLIGILICSLWLFLAEWHILVFSSFYLGIWIVWKLISERKVLKENLSTWLSFIMANFIVAIPVIPLGIKYLRISNLYSAVRTIRDVASTNWNTEYFYFLKYPLIFLFKLYDFIFNKDSSKWFDILGKEENVFPDMFSSIMFWLSFFVLLFAIIFFIKKKKQKLKYLPHLLTFILLYIIAIGPYLKIGGNIAETIKFPHYYLYYLIFPLSAIRAVWRATAVGFIAMCAYLSCLSINYKNVFKNKFSSLGMQLFGILILMLIFVFTWQQKTGNFYPALDYDAELFQMVENFEETEIDFFVWRKDYDNSDYNYFTSLFNSNHSNQRLNWVAGGTIGYPQSETTTLGDYLKNEKFANEIAGLLNKKNVDLIILDKTNYESDYLQNVKFQLSLNYSLIKSVNEKSYWLRKNKEDYVSNGDLEYSITMSSIQNFKQTIPIYISEVNNSDEIFTSNEYFMNFQFEILTKNRELIYSEKEQKISKPFLFPNWGSSFLFELIPKLVEGSYILSVNIDGKVIERTFTVISRSDFDELKNNSEEISFSENYYHENKFVYERDVMPVRMKAVVSAGVVNEDADISAIFRNDEGLMYNKYYQEFPVWWGQPECNLKGTYFEGDVIDFWCKQFIPADINFRYSSIQNEK